MKWLDTVLQRWRGAVARRWIPRGACVLDIGCHQGEFLRGLGNHLGIGIGVDPLATPASGRRWNLIRDCFPPANPFPPASFDTIVMLATLEHMQDKVELALECHRVLRPGGRIILTVPSLWVDPIVEVLVQFKLVDGMSLDQHHGYDPSETQGLFQAHGFTLLRRKLFQMGLNHLFVFSKRVTDDVAAIQPR